MKQYQHLSNEERFYIHQAVQEGKLKKDIAQALRRHPSTIGRERRRNMSPSAYLYAYDWSKYFMSQRKRRTNAHKHRKLTEHTSALIVQGLRRCLRPEQIGVCLRRHHGVLVLKALSVQSGIGRRVSENALATGHDVAFAYDAEPATLDEQRDYSYLMAQGFCAALEVAVTRLHLWRMRAKSLGWLWKCKCERAW